MFLQVVFVVDGFGDTGISALPNSRSEDYRTAGHESCFPSLVDSGEPSFTFLSRFLRPLSFVHWAKHRALELYTHVLLLLATLLSVVGLSHVVKSPVESRRKKNIPPPSPSKPLPASPRWQAALALSPPTTSPSIARASIQTASEKPVGILSRIWSFVPRSPHLENIWMKLPFTSGTRDGARAIAPQL